MKMKSGYLYVLMMLTLASCGGSTESGQAQTKKGAAPVNNYSYYEDKKVEESFYKGSKYYTGRPIIEQRKGYEQLDTLERFLPKGVGEVKFTSRSPSDINYQITKPMGSPFTHTERYYKGFDVSYRDTVRLDYYFTNALYEYDNMTIEVDFNVHNNLQSYLKKNVCAGRQDTDYSYTRGSTVWRYIGVSKNAVQAEYARGIVFSFFINDKSGTVFVQGGRDFCEAKLIDKVAEERIIKILEGIDRKALLKYVTPFG